MSYVLKINKMWLNSVKKIKWFFTFDFTNDYSWLVKWISVIISWVHFSIWLDRAMHCVQVGNLVIEIYVRKI